MFPAAIWTQILFAVVGVEWFFLATGTTMLSLVPLSIATTQIGGEGPPYFPMARAIAGGLAFSTVVTLLFLPTIYLLLDDLRSWAGNVVRLSRKG